MRSVAILVGLTACNAHSLDCGAVPRQLCERLAPERKTVTAYPQNEGPSITFDLPRGWKDEQPMVCPTAGHFELCNHSGKLDPDFAYNVAYGDQRDESGHIDISIGRDAGETFERRVFGEWAQRHADGHVVRDVSTPSGRRITNVDSDGMIMIARIWHVASDPRFRWCLVTLTEENAAAAPLLEAVCDRVDAE